VLLFGIATSVENFHEKLPRATLRLLEGQQFDAAQSEEILEKVFWKTIDDPDIALRIGSDLGQMLMDTQRDHVQSVAVFINSIKYAYMSHCFANRLSVFLKNDLQFDEVTKEDMEALRNLPSFRERCEGLLEAKDIKLLRKLLNSDRDLYDYAREQVTLGRKTLHNIITGITAFQTAHTLVPKTARIPSSALYVKAMSGGLDGSPMLRELLLSIKRVSSDVLAEILDELRDSQVDLPECERIQQELVELITSAGDSKAPFRSEHDVRNETLRTTVVSQKVELSKQKATLSKNDAAYSKLLNEFHGIMQAFFTDKLVSPKGLFLHEVFIYDMRAPHRATFGPKTRYAIERALSSPHDYLNCECCDVRGNKGADGTLSASYPSTAILYQLYLESGSLINVSDLWSAFQAILSDDHEDEGTLIALFQRGLAELNLLGMIKGSRKKTDHIAKMAWKGL